MGWRDPAKQPPREKQRNWGLAQRALRADCFPSVQFNVTLLWWGAKGHQKRPGGAGWGEQSHTACCKRERAGSYFNGNTDLRREERLENRDANSTSQEQHDCKYCLSRPRRQADHMHHVETFTKSVKFFSSTISWGFSALWSFPPKECTFCRTSQGYYFSNSPLNPPSPKYSSSFSLIITLPFLLLLLRFLVAALHLWAA